MGLLVTITVLLQINEPSTEQNTSLNSALGNTDTEAVTLPKSPPASPLVKEREMEAYNCNDQLLQIPTHTYSHSSSSQSPSSLPSSRSVVSPRPLTPSSTDSHISQEKSPSPHHEKVDPDRNSQTVPSVSFESEIIGASVSEKSNSITKNENDLLPEEKVESDRANEEKLNSGETTDNIPSQNFAETPAVTSEVSKFISASYYHAYVSLEKQICNYIPIFNSSSTVL